MDNEERSKFLVKRYEQLKSERGTLDAHYTELARLIYPHYDMFNNTRVEGDKKTEYIFDSTAPLALERCAAGFESMITPRTQKWHTLTTGNEQLDSVKSVQIYLQKRNEILFNARYAPLANFASQMHEFFSSLCVFGTACLFVDEYAGRHLRYKSIGLNNIYIDVNYQGLVDTVFRSIKMTSRQAAQQFGYDALPDSIKQDIEKSSGRQFEFFHAVYPNEDRQYGNKTYRGMKYSSCYVACDGKKIVSEGGYNSLPYAVGRYATPPQQKYGYSPAMVALPDIKMLNQMSSATIRAAQMAVSPPILTTEDLLNDPINMIPNGIHYGGLDENGREMMRPWNSGSRIDIAEDQMERRRRTINDALFVTLFQVQLDAPRMTATEAMLRAQEKGALLAPVGGRQQSESLPVIIERESDILERAGLMPPMPPELLESGSSIHIEFVSPLNKVQKSEEGVGILRTLESVVPMAQVMPGVLDMFDYEKVVRHLAEINGVPADLLKDEKELAALKEQRSQSEQAQQLLSAAPVASKSLLEMSQAQALAASSATPAPNIFQ